MEPKMTSGYVKYSQLYTCRDYWLLHLFAVLTGAHLSHIGYEHFSPWSSPHLFFDFYFRGVKRFVI